ncbi:MAG: hypothetical protein KBB33_07240, partial [Candidatus Cloacimonetes bacterium]|nr:hypothetical protein [Candidatus Cloacimonadota bacterium]
MKPFAFLLLIMGLLLLGSCDKEASETISQREIRDLFYELSLDYNLGNVYGILDRVHVDYLHKGNIVWHLNEEILDRMARFQLLEIEVLYVEFQGDRHAVVHSRDRYSSAIEDITYNEPESSGYFSYLYRDNNTWLIYG